MVMSQSKVERTLSSMSIICCLSSTSEAETEAAVAAVPVQEEAAALDWTRSRTLMSCVEETDAI